MNLTVTKLSSGWVQVRGEGFNDFWQGPQYPAGEDVLPLGFFEECSQDFRRAVFSDNRERLKEAFAASKEKLAPVFEAIVKEVEE